ncbi:MAG: response regulator, partial [Treponema sp.]|nr:response regulator [Treponema sp.]
MSQLLLPMSLLTLGLGIYGVYKPNLKNHGSFSLVCFTLAVWSFSLRFYALKQPAALSTLGLHAGEICILTLFVLGTASLCALTRFNAVPGRIILGIQIAALFLFAGQVLRDTYMRAAETGGGVELIIIRGNSWYAALSYNILSPLLLAAMAVIRFRQLKPGREKGECLLWIVLLVVCTVFLAARFISPVPYDRGIIVFAQLALFAFLLRLAVKGGRGTITTENIARHLFRVLESPILIVNTRGIIIRANTGAESYFERGTRNIEGSPVESIFEFAEGGYELFPEPVENGEKKKTSYSVRIRESSARCHIEVSYVYAGGGEPLCALFVVTDESEKMRLIEELEEARQKAEAASLLKTSFLAKTSHEIRTPMNAIVGMAELILRENIPPAAQEQAMNIKQASANLLSIINDILDFSKIESGKLNIQNLNYYLSSVVNDVINIIRMRILEKNLLFITKIDSNLPNMLKGDEIRIRQILLNLLSNAAKYTNEGFVSLSIGGRTANTDMELVISITDSGIGIKDEDRNNIFKNFVQVDTAANAGTEGTGLGLPIAKELCELMGGSISFESRYGKGSTFTVRLPQKINCPMESPGAAGEDSRPYPSDRFAWVEKPEGKKILFYTARTLYGDSYSWAAKNLGIDNTLVFTQQEFIETLEKSLETGEYSHILIFRDLFKSSIRIMEGMGIAGNGKPRLVQINEYGLPEKGGAEVYTIYTPVHTLTLANVLNDKPMGFFENNRKGKPRFTAPGLKLLLVDDVGSNLRVAEGLLKPYGMRIDTCTSGYEAVAKIKQQRYDLVLLDHMMPGMDGVETALAIRRLESPDRYFQRLPLVALTANAVTGIKEMFVENGLSDFLAKPIDISQLDAILNKWIPDEKKVKMLPDEEDRPAEKAAEFAISGLDFGAGLSRCGENWESYSEILGLFCEDGKRRLGELRRSIDEDNFPLFTATIRGIVSAGKSIGAVP